MDLPEFDGDAFREQVDYITMVKSGLLDYATAYADGRLTFTFKNGSTFEG